jgi:hypothetical protein
MSAVYLAAAIVLEICGTTSLKLSEGFTRLAPSGAVVLCYAASFALLSLALRGIALSIAYAVWSGGRYRGRSSDRRPVVRRECRPLEALVSSADRGRRCRATPGRDLALTSLSIRYCARSAAQPRNAGSGWVTTKVGIASR